MGISVPDFEYLRDFLQENTAIVLDDDKQYLAESRLINLSSAEGFPSVQQMLEELRSTRTDELRRKVLDAMTNNETWFFRDGAPFEVLQTSILPQLIQRRLKNKELTIWSAAASSGQEPYSIAMLVREHFPSLRDWNLRILGTDVSERILKRCEEAKYSELEVSRGLPPELLEKYFERAHLEWRLSSAIRKMVTLRTMNLAEPWSLDQAVDVIFLRNVLIYFNMETKKRILARVATALAPDGYLFLGCAETTLNLSDEFERIQQGATFCYRLKSKGRKA